MTTFDPDHDLALLAAAGLATTRYARFRPDLGIGVRATRTPPKFWKGPPLVWARTLTPSRRVAFDRTLSDVDARLEFMAQLDDEAGTTILFLGQVARQFRGQRLVVLCYEDVLAGQTCHRTWVGEWFEDRYGIVVPELDV